MNRGRKRRNFPYIEIVRWYGGFNHVTVLTGPDEFEDHFELNQKEAVRLYRELGRALRDLGELALLSPRGKRKKVALVFEEGGVASAEIQVSANPNEPSHRSIH